MDAMNNNDTRTKLIKAAYYVLAKKGYESSSIKEIAREANVSPGLVHYYFKNKEELLAAVLKDVSDEYCRQMEELSSSIPLENLANTALSEPKERVSRHPEWYKLRYELFVLGLRHPAIRSGVSDLLNNGRLGIGDVVRNVGGETISNPTAIASVLLACFDGLALQKMIDPDYDLDSAYQILSQMALSLLEQG